MADKKKMREFLEDVCAYYNSKNRAVSKKTGCCVYYDPETLNRCAIGREMSLNDAKKLHLNHGSVGVSANFVLKSIPHRLRIMGVNFLKQVQNLHDTDLYWDEHGITKEGVNFKETIIDSFGLHTTKEIYKSSYENT